MTLRITLGIDPGQTGAIAALADGQYCDVADMPLIRGKEEKGRQHIDGDRLSAWLRELSRRNPGAAFEAVIEQVSARPKQGVTGVFRFGEAYGVVRGVLAGLGISFRVVHPSRWKSAMGLVGEQKDASREVAAKTFPAAVSKLQRKKDHGRAEAMLIAKWAHSCEVAA